MPSSENNIRVQVESTVNTIIFSAHQRLKPGGAFKKLQGQLCTSTHVYLDAVGGALLLIGRDEGGVVDPREGHQGVGVQVQKKQGVQVESTVILFSNQSSKLGVLSI